MLQFQQCNKFQSNVFATSCRIQMFSTMLYHSRTRSETHGEPMQQQSLLLAQVAPQSQQTPQPFAIPQQQPVAPTAPAAAPSGQQGQQQMTTEQYEAMTDEQKSAYWAQYQQWAAYYAQTQAASQPSAGSPAPTAAAPNAAGAPAQVCVRTLASFL